MEESVSPAAPAHVPDGWVMVPRKELGDGISLLHRAMVGACDCLSKTHEAKYHAENCFYRLLSEQCDKLEATIAASPAAPVVRELLTDEQIIKAASNWDCGTRDENEEWAFKRPRELLLFAREVLALSAAPVVREPLTDAQIRQISDKHFACADDAEEDVFWSAWVVNFARAIEAANGITGGSK